MPKSNDGIPAALKAERRWIGVHRGTKRPCRRNWNQSTGWMTYEDAAKNNSSVGFVLGDGFVGFDFDGVVNGSGDIPDYVRDILESVDSYTEVSKSGAGLHVIAKTQEGDSLKTIAAGSRLLPASEPFEFYPRSRMFILTGDVFEQRSTLRDATRQINDILLSLQHDGLQGESHLWRPWSEVNPRLDEDTVYTDAENFVSRMQPAIQGEGGSTQLMKVCQSLAWGFALDEDEAWPILQSYNTRCNPPFDDTIENGPDSLLKKLRDSYCQKCPKHRPGGLLRDRHQEAVEAFKHVHVDESEFDSEYQSRVERLRFAGLPLASIWAEGSEEIDWLVEGVFSSDQPTVFGARKKTMKTTFLMDLAVSLAVESDWLGMFRVPQRRRVLFITGETNNRAAARRFRKACGCRGIGPVEIADWLRIEAVEFPKLPRLEDCIEVQNAIREFGIEVVILDPLYRGLTGDVNSANLFEMGDALGQFMDYCRPASLIVSHHVRKGATRRGSNVLDLDDLSGAGLAEFAGNYFLMDRLVPYEFDGQHDLSVAYGGRDEQAESFGLTFNEETWDVEKRSLASYYEEKASVKADARIADMQTRIRDFLKTLPEASEAKIASACRTAAGRPVFQDALAELIKRGEAEQISNFRSGNRKCKGVRLAGNDNSCQDSS